MGLAAPDHTRTLRDGSFENAFPGTSCQTTIGVSLGDGLADGSQRLESASNFITGMGSFETETFGQRSRQIAWEKPISQILVRENSRK